MLGHLTCCLTVPYVLTLHTGRRALLGGPSAPRRRGQRSPDAALGAALLATGGRSAGSPVPLVCVPDAESCRTEHPTSCSVIVRATCVGASMSRPSTRVLLTFGLVSPGKGIEHTIAVMPALRAEHRRRSARGGRSHASCRGRGERRGVPREVDRVGPRPRGERRDRVRGLVPRHRRARRAA